MRCLFISDLHLEASRPTVVEAFEQFLAAEGSRMDRLYVLGDLFEVWLGDDDESAFNDRVKTALAAVSCPKYVMHGNRDFLLGDVFCRDTSMTLMDDPSAVDLDGDTWLLLHGDTLCTLDTAYMEARKMLRNPAFQADFLARSLEERAAFASSVRAESQSHTSTTDMGIMDVTPDEVTRILEEAGLSRMIHGHTHRPAVHELTLSNGTSASRIVLGDWGESGWALEVTDGKPSLRSFAIG